MNTEPYFDPLRLVPFHRTFMLLEQGAVYATVANIELEQFAVPVKPILEIGLKVVDLRIMISDGHVVHLIEQPLKSGVRRFMVNNTRHLDQDRSCFILTPKGRKHAGGITRRVDGLVLGGTLQPETATKYMPRWDSENRQLYWHVWLVKRLSPNAGSQEPIIQLFQDHGFPEWIEYRLPNCHGVDRDSHLHNALQGLNRGQTACKIEFYRDGSKSRINWRKV